MLLACGPDDISRPLLSEHANRLLSADQEKSWQLVAKEIDGVDQFNACMEQNQLLFVNSTVQDSLYILGRPDNCIPTEAIDTLFKAKYELRAESDGTFSNTILLSEQKHLQISRYLVEQLSADRLQLKFTLDDQQIIEHYAN